MNNFAQLIFSPLNRRAAPYAIQLKVNSTTFYQFKAVLIWRSRQKVSNYLSLIFPIHVMSTIATPEHPHQIPIDQLLKDLNVDPKAGLTAEEAKNRYDELGPNALQEVKRESAITILLRQFTGVIVYILAAAAGISFFLGETVEGFAIIAVLLVNAITGFLLEWNARQSMDALRKMDTTPARVLRDGRIREISSEEVTLGDILAIWLLLTAIYLRSTSCKLTNRPSRANHCRLTKIRKYRRTNRPWAISTTAFSKERP